VTELRALAAAAGRGQIPVTCYPKPAPEEIERAAAAGVERSIFYVSPDGRDKALAQLEDLHRLIEPYQG